MELNAEAISMIAKFAGIGGVAVFAMAIVFRDLIGKKFFPVLKKDHAYKLLMTVTMISGFISLAGIIAWVVINVWPGKDTNEVAKARNAASDSRILRANELHYKSPNWRLARKEFEIAANEKNPIAMAQLSAYLSDGIGGAKDTVRANLLARKSVPTLEIWCTNLEVLAACFSLSLLYDNGLYVKQDEEKAFDLSRKAAIGGYPRAYNPTAYMFEVGHGTDKNISQAIEWYEKAVEHGYPIAMLSLSEIYKKGDYIDEGKSLSLLNRAAELGFPSAQYALALEYESGVRVKKDIDKMRLLLEAAAHAGDNKAQNELAHRYHKGKAPYLKDEKASYEWYLKSARSGDVWAMVSVGQFYRYGTGVEKDISESMRWLKSAAESGDSVAQLALGYAYSIEGETTHSYAEAFKWFMLSANQDNVEAQINVAFCYRDGLGVKKNSEEAFDWALKSANQGYAPAQNYLGNVFYKKNDYKTAMDWYQKAALQNDPVALNNIGSMFESGNGVDESTEKSNSYYKKAYDIDPENYLFASDYWFSEFILAVSGEAKEFAFSKLYELAEKENGEAQWRLYGIYRLGISRPVDHSKKLYWLEKAAINGHICGSLDWGLALLSGDGVKQDVVSALQFIEKSRGLGNTDALHNLGSIYMVDKYTARDVEKGIRLLEESAGGGSLDSLVYLGKLYRDGAGVPRDIAKSAGYLAEAAKLGSKEAIKQLEQQNTGSLKSCTAIPSA